MNAPIKIYIYIFLKNMFKSINHTNANWNEVQSQVIDDTYWILWKVCCFGCWYSSQFVYLNKLHRKHMAVKLRQTGQRPGNALIKIFLWRSQPDVHPFCLCKPSMSSEKESKTKKQTFCWQLDAFDFSVLGLAELWLWFRLVSKVVLLHRRH